MNLVFLHGAPATGKYTVGRELAARSGCMLYHNHVAVDEALARHSFGTPEFVTMRDRLWRDFLGRALRQQSQDLIFTFAPENTVPQEFVDWLFRSADECDVTILSVELTAPESVIEARLDTGPRRDFRKLTEPELYRRLRESGSFSSPVIPRTDLRVDTSAVAPEAATRLIASALKLRRPPGC